MSAQGDDARPAMLEASRAYDDAILRKLGPVVERERLAELKRTLRALDARDDSGGPPRDA